MSDVAIMSEQIRAARALLRWEQKDLAERSGVSLPSIKRIETKAGPVTSQPRTVIAIISALVAAGVSFDLSEGTGPGVRLRA